MISICQENRNWISEFPGKSGNEGPISQRKGARTIVSEAKCSNWHKEFNNMFNSKLDTVKKMNEL